LRKKDHMEFPSFKLDNKVALVTGAARGLGKACALALAHAGADMALGLRDVHSADDLVKEIKSMGRKVIKLQMDVGHMDQIKDAVRKTHQEFGRIDILVNNVGIAPPNPAEEVTEKDYDLTLNLNVKATFFIFYAVGRIMIEQGGGKIINMSSQAGFIALDDESIYCMTKAAINHLTRNLASEWAKYNINVNAVAPTFIETPGTEPWLNDPDFRQSVIDRIPLGRVGKPVEVAGAVVFLASEAASLITGEVMLIDGGWTAR
jgi:NAD(P)-dependent dehydrogenase (short-subunit alcohol dehydrogenase family)